MGRMFVSHQKAKQMTTLAALLVGIGFTMPVAALSIRTNPAADPAMSIRHVCQALTAHQPDGSVDYIPGKDVYWRDVAPADLDNGDGQINVSYPLTMAITLDQARQFNLVPRHANYTPEMFVGLVRVEKDGSVYFNDKRLSQPQTQFLCDPNVNP